MYRIELAPGEEALFKSIDEMAAGITNGVITSQARIWHQTSGKWLPIEFHPHYKIALTKGPATQPKPEYREAPAVAGPAAIASTPPIFDKPAARPLFESPVAKPAPSPYAPPSTAAIKSIFDRPTAETAAVAPQFVPAIEVVMHAPEPTTGADRVAASVAPASDGEFVEIHQHPRSKGRTWTVGLVAAGAVVVLGGGAALSAFHSSHTPPPVRKSTMPNPASYGAQPVVPPPIPATATHSTRPVSDSIVAGTKPVDPAATIADAPRIVDAPRVSFSGIGLSDSDRPASDRPSGMTPTVLVSHYAAAYEAARTDLDRGIRLAGLGGIFSASRLGAGDIAAARSTLAGAANLVRVYRKRGAQIEQTYRDSVNLLTRQIGWTPAQIAIWENRPTQLESAEAASLANALLDAIDGALAVLSAHEGGYEISGAIVTFREAQAARDYGAARRRLEGLTDNGADSGTPAGRILRALGKSQLPEERAGS